MPAKTGASHGVAAYTSFLIGSILSKTVWDIMPPVGELSLATIETIQTMTGADIPVNRQLAGTVVVMLLLSAAWGTIYHVARH